MQNDPDWIDAPSNHGDYRRINLSALLAGFGLAVVIGLLALGVIILIQGCPPKAGGSAPVALMMLAPVNFQIEAGPGQENANLASLTASLESGLTWLRFDPHLAAIFRERWHGGLGLDITAKIPALHSFASFSFGRIYWPDPTSRVSNQAQWHLAAHLGKGRWLVGLHHWSSGRQCGKDRACFNEGENFLTVGRRW